MLVGSLNDTVHRGDGALEKPGLLPQASELVQPLCKAPEADGDPRAGLGPARCSFPGWTTNLGEATDPPTGWELLWEGMGCSCILAVAPCDAGNVEANLGWQHTPSSTAKRKASQGSREIKGRGGKIPAGSTTTQD